MRHRGLRIGLWGLGVLVLFGFTMIPTILLTVIWPGEAKLTAPLFCSDARPEAFVVTDTYSDGTGETATNFTMYCVGPRGDADDIGWAKPFLVLSVVHTLLLLAVIGVLVWRRRRRPTRRPVT